MKTRQYDELIRTARNNAFLSPDKEKITSLIDLLESIIYDRCAPHEGVFAKYSDVIERNPWLHDVISDVFMKWLLSA